ncbi:MAG: phosphatidylserine synthase [Acidobacteria bacterium]|nr:phosphatidylserine synthase [Acidobacteriota bacterium]
MKLIVEPDDGVKPLLEAIAGARKSIDIAIFRCDVPAIERALVEAIQRGVTVRASIAFTNRGGEARLRGLEMRLLAAGAVVARTSNDLSRYHGKYLIIDQKRLIVLAFNFSREDLRSTRTFGASTLTPALVREAIKLFDADCTRQEFRSDSKYLLVSPVNARGRLAEYLRGAKRELLIYDVEVSDPEMLRVLKERASRGVKIRIIGKAKGKDVPGEVRAPHPLRLHARAIVRDRASLYIGSQSLRRLELDLRREVGIILPEEPLAAKVAKIFEHDWTSAKAAPMPVEKLARKVAKEIVKELGPIEPVLEQVAAKNGAKIDTDSDAIEQAVREAVKSAVRDVVHEAAVQPADDK